MEDRRKKKRTAARLKIYEGHTQKIYKSLAGHFNRFTTSVRDFLQSVGTFIEDKCPYIVGE